LGSDTHPAKVNVTIAMMMNLEMLTKLIVDPMLCATK
jgi:hypothetical protein